MIGYESHIAIQCYCKHIGVEPKRPVQLMDAYELLELADQIKERESELGMTPIDIERTKRKVQEYGVVELVVLALAIGLIIGIMIGVAVCKH